MVRPHRHACHGMGFLLRRIKSNLFIVSMNFSRFSSVRSRESCKEKRCAFSRISPRPMLAPSVCLIECLSVYQCVCLSPQNVFEESFLLSEGGQTKSRKFLVFCCCCLASLSLILLYYNPTSDK